MEKSVHCCLCIVEGLTTPITMTIPQTYLIGACGIAIQSDFFRPRPNRWNLWANQVLLICGVRKCVHFSMHGNLCNQKSVGLHNHGGEAEIHFHQFCAPYRESAIDAAFITWSRYVQGMTTAGFVSRGMPCTLQWQWYEGHHPAVLRVGPCQLASYYLGRGRRCLLGWDIGAVWPLHTRTTYRYRDWHRCIVIGIVIIIAMVGPGLVL